MDLSFPSKSTKNAINYGLSIVSDALSQLKNYDGVQICLEQKNNEIHLVRQRDDTDEYNSHILCSALGFPDLPDSSIYNVFVLDVLSFKLTRRDKLVVEHNFFGKRAAVTSYLCFLKFDLPKDVARIIANMVLHGTLWPYTNCVMLANL